MPRSEEYVPAAAKAACTCDPCKRKKGMPNSVRSGVIHSYSSQPPTGWAPRRTKAEMENGDEATTFGVELETSLAEPVIRDLPHQPESGARTYGDEPPEYIELERARHAVWLAWVQANSEYHSRQELLFLREQHMSGDEAVSQAKPRGLWHAKHDGSVSGPEFASHPATLAYWRAARPHVSAMMKALLHGGLRSHDGDACGLHINIGTDTFRSDADHLERFARLVTVNPRWSTRMSQRTNHSMNHWAPITGYLDLAGYRQEWAGLVARYGHAGQNRYCVLNAENRGRVEFRLPRGTLRVDRFYAKLEWTDAMIEYTRDPANIVQISPFMRWCDKATDASGEREYPELVAFMRERFSAERFGEVPA